MTETSAAQPVLSTRFSIKYADIRHIFDDDGNPWFVAKDICDYLDIENPSTAYSRVWDDAKKKCVISLAGDYIHNTDMNTTDSPGREIVVVSEPGLYQLIFMSRKPEADAFRRWVFYELLPQLRHHGSYQLRGGTSKMLPPLTASPVQRQYAGQASHPTRFGHQPLAEVLKERRISRQAAFDAMNELELPGVPKIKTTYGSQLDGRNYVGVALAFRASAWLGLPVESLFTEASRSRLPATPQ
jgi:prophage antirepressor-like protein